mgnify:CR=1 FL=1
MASPPLTTIDGHAIVGIAIVASFVVFFPLGVLVYLLCGEKEGSMLPSIIQWHKECDY